MKNSYREAAAALIVACVSSLVFGGCQADPNQEDRPDGSAPSEATGGVLPTSPMDADGVGGSSDSGSGGHGGEANPGSQTGGTGAGPGEEVDEVPSTGCGSETDLLRGDWAELPSMMVDGVERHHWVMLPEEYDPDRPYPVVFMFHGCGNEMNNIPMDQVVGQDAILVRATGINDGVCWHNSDADLEFFVNMTEGLSQDFCIDESRRFAAGYSSGAWLINMLECRRGDLLRATGTVAGGTPGGHDECEGTVARLFIHDVGDDQNAISGNVTERDRLLELNSCSEEDPVAEDPAPCVRYTSCDADYPVVWCETTERGHGRQDFFAPDAMWGFFTEF